MYWQIIGLFCIALTPSANPAQSAAVPAAQSLENTQKVGERLVSLDLPNARLAQVVEALGKTHGINIVADAYSDDMRVSVKVTDIPLRMALPQLASLYERRAQIVNGIVVLRHQDWFRRPEQEKFSTKHYQLRWKDQGKVTVRTAAQGISGTTASTVATLGLAARANLSATLAVTPGAAAAPVQLMDVDATAAPLGAVTQPLAAQAGWSIFLEPTLQNRRVSVSLRRVTPGQALEALTLLLNARQEVRVSQSDEQKQQEADLLARYADERPDWLKKSDALKEDLMALLTPEQRASLDNNEVVPLALDSLSPAARARAQDYINVLAGNSKINLDQFKTFMLEIRPEPGLAVNAWGVTDNGNRIGL